MGLLSWIIFGALAGWVASMITGRQQGCCLNVIVGVVGAFIGGLLMEVVTGRVFTFSFSFQSFLVAVVGSIVLLAVVLAFGRRRWRM